MSSAALLKELQEMPREKFNRLMPRIFAIRARALPNVLPANESRLVEKIRAGMPQKWDDEYRALVEKRRSVGLSKAERERVLQLTEDMETFDVRWLKWVVQLAKMRGMTPEALLKSLKLPKRPYV